MEHVLWGVAPRAPVQYFVGIDWATEKHDVSVVDPDGREVGQG
jgi:hypothetical protein